MVCYITPYINKHLLNWNHLALGLREEYQLSEREQSMWDIFLSNMSVSPQIP